ncbi:MAG: D-2-hydroxyacid dehydrogenase [Clostridia bacterium]
MTKIVVLDASPMSQNDITIESLSKLGEFFAYERTPDNLIIERIGDAEIVLTNKVLIDKNVMDLCPNIKFISILATGTNVVDLEYAKSKGIIVSNVPAYSTESVAQHTFALYLELCSKVGIHTQSVHNGDWVNSKDFCYCLDSVVEINNKVFGIIGYGNIGKRVAEIAKAFGMKVLINNRTPFEGSVSINEVLEKSDVVSLHCPLTSANEKFINKNTISKMKKSAVIINTARGGLIEEQDLADALNSKQIAGAGLDVLTIEKPNKDNPLLSATNCIITPHIAWASYEARARLLEVTRNNIIKYLDKKPQNVVNK